MCMRKSSLYLSVGTCPGLCTPFCSGGGGGGRPLLKFFQAGGGGGGGAFSTPGGLFRSNFNPKNHNFSDNYPVIF